MEKARIFKTNRSQAVRIPKAAAFPENVKEVDILIMGNARLITPAGEAWSTWFDGNQVSDDFMSNRDQPADQERELF